MQIKFCYKMAKNDGPITLCTNIVQENERMLQESCCENPAEAKSKEDFDKLFTKLNYICQARSTKEDAQLNTPWTNKSVINYTYGPISGFPSGSWWGIRMDCSRDRVHDPFDENIQNGPFGVVSICTSSVNLTEDVDFGNFLTLTGQKYVDGRSDKDPLFKNYENQIPVRLIRSYNLLNEFAPKTGYRYDGLYTVNNFWIGENSDSTKYYKFALSRLNEQEPPSWITKQSSSNASKLFSAVNCVSIPEYCSPNVYTVRKYLHDSEATIQKGRQEKSDGFLQLPNFESKRTDEREKSAHESGIVTRHVFKKTNTSAEHTLSVASTSVTSDNKSLTHIGTQGSKTHNTNISIRTGLYDSSHSTQHDAKKSTLSPFCRTAKSVSLLKPNHHTENSSLCGKDKSRCSDGKTQAIAPNEVHKRREQNSGTNGVSLSPSYKHECNYGKAEKPEDSRESHKGNEDSHDTPTNMLSLTNFMYRNETAQKAMSKEAQELRSIDSLDSLTPDKILHLIDKKCHPLSKLLMGNMIGLSSEQSTSLKTQDLPTVQSDVGDTVAESSEIEETKGKKTFESISEDLIAARCYKFRRRRKLSRRILNISEMRKCGKTHNGKLQKGAVQSSDILSQNSTILATRDDSQKSSSDLRNSVQRKETNLLQEPRKSIKKNVGNKSEARTRLRAMKTMKSSMKKHMNTKQRREIANLLIDAKIGPKIRGPRNRRLRCIDNAYAKQSYEPFSTAICTLNKCQRSTFNNRNTLTKIGGYKRVGNKKSRNVKRSETMNLKQNGIHKNLTVSKKMDKDHGAEKTANDQSDSNRHLETVEKTKAQAKCTTVAQNRKRKLMETASGELKCGRVDEVFRKGYKSKISMPYKTDAVTQCSLIKEPFNNFSQNHNRNEQYTFIKIEYSDVKDMKSEACHETTRSGCGNIKNRTQRSTDRVKCTKTAGSPQHPSNTKLLLNSNVSSAKEHSRMQESERLSAFVPVNVVDSDLKIARLRSIGFKPIISYNNSDENVNIQANGNSSATLTSKVLKQNVAEKYNKYTNEENDVVVYMDDELQYQDIEDEDIDSLSNRRKASALKIDTSMNERLDRLTLENISCDGLLEQDFESPWHGWKKVVTNKHTYWVGW